MPPRLRRYYGAGYLHFITTSCYQRQPLLAAPRNQDLFLHILEQVRCRYLSVVVGYVVMPEHIHLLLSEPERANPSVVTQALKQGFARRLLSRVRSRQNHRQASLWDAALAQGHIWQRRFYDFVVRTEHQRIEKLRYMHRNPVGQPPSGQSGFVRRIFLTQTKPGLEWRTGQRPHAARFETLSLDGVIALTTCQLWT